MYMRVINFRFVVLLAALVGTIAGSQFAHAQNADVFTTQQAMRSQSARVGMVAQVRYVRIEANQTTEWAGRGAGAAVGGVLGSRIGKEGSTTRQVGALLGAVLGAAAGDMAADRMGGEPNAQELVVEMADGNVIVVVQAGVALQPGMKVYIVSDSNGWNNSTRVIPAMQPSQASYR